MKNRRRLGSSRTRGSSTSYGWGERDMSSPGPREVQPFSSRQTAMPTRSWRYPVTGSYGSAPAVPGKIFTWTPTEGTGQITSNGYSDGYPEVSGDRVVWYGYDGADRDIFTWTPADGITQLTANSYQEDHQQVSGDRVVWIGEDGTDYEVFAWTPAGGTVKITSNSREEREPQVSGDRDRVDRANRRNGDDEIFTARCPAL